MTVLESYAEGRWVSGTGNATTLLHAVTGEAVAEASSGGLDFGGMVSYARRVGGPVLRRMTFHERALMLKRMAQYLMERKDEFYASSAATGATRADSWIDIEGGIATFFVYSSKGRRELPDERFFVEGEPERISRNGTFAARHICVPLEGVAIHINAFNFPCWGMLEKLAPALLAGMPAIVKPATQTSYLTQLMVRRMVESQILPEGAVQLVCGSAGDLFEYLGCQDAVAFTGSAATGLKLRQHPKVMRHSVRFNMEADSLNCSILGPDAAPGTEEFDLFIKEVVREMTVKAGQKCTAIRRAIVPERALDAVVEALRARLARTVVGDPAREGVKMGPLVSLAQRAEVRERVAELSRASELVAGDPDDFEVAGADAERGAFLPPLLLHCPKPLRAGEVHAIEAFGPVSTVMPYSDVEQAIELAKLGEGSLCGSLFTNDDDVARTITLGTAAWHGRLMLMNRDCAGESTGHGSPLPHLVHGGPGRAGGGEEMGGIRGVLHYMQRTALQGSPTTIARVCDEWMSGARELRTDVHPFRKHFEELEIGETIVTAGRLITLEDIERFADLSGDRFYAHMDSDAAKANPFFEDRVAHGYFVVSMAAGLFVDPAPGPVLANYGLEHLRFIQPVYVGDTLHVRFTCKRKTLRHGEDYGEVQWDTEVINQKAEAVASYTVLTLVRCQALPLSSSVAGD